MIRLFRVFIPTTVIGLLVSEILIAVACFVVGYLITGTEDMEVYFLLEDGIARTAIVVLTLIFGIYWADLYEDMQVTSALQLYQQFCLITGMAFLGQALVGYVDRQMIMPRWQMLIGSVGDRVSSGLAVSLRTRSVEDLGTPPCDVPGRQ